MPKPDHLAHPPVVRQPRNNHTVNISTPQPGILQRLAKRDQAKLVGRALRVKVAVDRPKLRRANANDRRLVLQIAKVTAVRLVAHAASLGRVPRATGGFPLVRQCRAGRGMLAVFRKASRDELHAMRAGERGNNEQGSSGCQSKPNTGRAFATSTRSNSLSLRPLRRSCNTCGC